MVQVWDKKNLSKYLKREPIYKQFEMLIEDTNEPIIL